MEKISLVHNYYETNNYKLFVNSNLNRDINIKYVKSLAESIAKIGLKIPIHVVRQGKKFCVIDGFHRVEACILAGKPIKYIIDEQASNDIEVITAINKLNLKWINANFIKSYLAEKNENYIQYVKFAQAHPEFPNNALGVILCTSLGGRFKASEFKGGKFQIGDIGIANLFMNDLLAIKPYDKIYCNVKFVRAFVRIWNHPRYNHQIFLNSIQKPKFRRYFEGLDNHQRILMAIYEVYNDKLRDGNRIEFGE